MFKKFFLVFIILFIVTLCTFINKPEWFFNESLVSYIARTFTPEDTKVNWKQYDMSSQLIEGKGKRLSLKLQNLCYQTSFNKACFKSIHLDIDFSSFLYVIGKIRVSHASLLGGEIEIIPSEKQITKKQTQTDIDFNSINKIIIKNLKQVGKYLVGDFKLEVLKLDYHGQYEVQAQVDLKSDDSLGLNGKALFKIENLKDKEQKSNLELDIKTNSTDIYQISAKAKSALPERSKFSLQLEKSFSSNLKLLEELTIDGNFASPTITTDFKTKAKRSQNEISLFFEKLNIFINQKRQSLKAKSNSCVLKLSPEKLLLDIGLVCPVLEAEGHVQKKSIKKFNSNGSLKINLQDISSTSQQTEGNIEVDLNLETNKIAKINLTINDKFKITNDLKKTFIPKFKLQANIEKVQEIYPYLRPYNLVPPAPFYALRGSVNIIAFKDPLDQNVQFELTTNLLSKNQKLNMIADGKYSLNKNHLTANVNLSEVKIITPKINILKQTSLIPSSNIKFSKEAYEKSKKTIRPKKARTKNKQEISYKIMIKTKKPILVSNNLTETAVPIELNLSLEDNLSGEVSINNYQLELFRRAAFVEYAKIKTTGEKEKPDQIDAKILMNHIDMFLPTWN